MIKQGLPQWFSTKESTCNAGDGRDAGLIPGWRRSPGGGRGNPFHYSCLKTLIDRGAWWVTVQRVTKSWILLKLVSLHAWLNETWYSTDWSSMLSLEVKFSIHLKTTKRYYLMLVRMVIIKTSKNNLSAREDVEKKELSYAVGEKCKLVQPLWRTVWGFLKKN